MAFNGQIISLNNLEQLDTQLTNLNTNVNTLVTDAADGKVEANTISNINNVLASINELWNTIYTANETDDNSINDELSAIEGILGIK